MERMKIQEAAELMECTPQFLRLALQQGRFRFGVAVKGAGGRFSYYISRHQFEKETGIKTGGAR